MKTFEWRPIETAPKDGEEILLCMPGGQSDHFYVVYWEDEGEWPGCPQAWVSRYHDDLRITEDAIKECYLKPYWTDIPWCPSSLCFGIVPFFEEQHSE